MRDADRLPSVRQLHAFHAALETGSIGAAARALRLSQPALSQSLRKLEQRVHATLLRRDRAGAQATMEGTALKRRIDRFRLHLSGAFAAAAGPAAGDEMRVWRVTLAQMAGTIAVADAGSFSGAARRLALSDSSIHRAVRDLEALVGRSILRRTPDGLSLTRIGRELSRGLRLALAELEQALEEVGTGGGGAGGRLVVGTLPLAKTNLLPAAIDRLSRLYPLAGIEVVEGSYDQLLTDLAEARIDILIGALRRPPPIPQVVEEQLFVDEFSIVARAGHPLAGRADLTVADLARCDWVIARSGTPIRAVFDRLFAGAVPETPVRASVETSSLLVIRSLMAHSDRLTVLSRRQILFEQRHDVLTTLAFRLPWPERPIGFTIRRDWEPTAMQSDFMRLLREVAKEPDLASEAGPAAVRGRG